LTTKTLTSGSIPYQVRDLAVPSSIGYFFHTMYNVVDSFYAGQVSTLALAALGLSFPVFLIIIATAGGLSRGSSALVSNAIGAEDHSRKKEYVEQSFSLGLFVSIVLTIIGCFAASPLFQLLGASGEYLSVSLEYIIPIFLGTVFFVGNNLCNAILVAHGDSKTFSKVLIVGFFANLILDPWFLYGGAGLPALGIAGIAWATVAIQVGSSAYMFWIVLNRGYLNLKPWTSLLPKLKVYGEIGVQALPSTFNIVSVSLGFFLITYFVKLYGEASVAAFGVTTRIEQIGFLPTTGLSTAIMAMVGQNSGAKNFERVRQTMRFCVRVGLALNLVVSLLMFAFARQLMGVFTSDPEVISLGVNCLRIIIPIHWSYVMTSAHVSMLQAIKRPLCGFFESILRRVLLPLPFFVWFVLYQEYSVDLVWYSVAGTNVLMTFVTIFYARWMLNRLIRQQASDSGLPKSDTKRAAKA
jgi:putative MATE family efflux protein